MTTRRAEPGRYHYFVAGQAAMGGPRVYRVEIRRVRPKEVFLAPGFTRRWVPVGEVDETAEAAVRRYHQRSCDEHAEARRALVAASARVRWARDWLTGNAGLSAPEA
jgi:hypothetical protein